MLSKKKIPVYVNDYEFLGASTANHIVSWAQMANFTEWVVGSPVCFTLFEEFHYVCVQGPNSIEQILIAIILQAWLG